MPKFVRISAALVFGAMVIEAHAEPSDTQVCKSIYDFAETTMRARQQNMPMPETLTFAGGNDILESIVLQAYQAPAYRSQEYRQAEIQEFANRQFSDCMQVMRAAR